MTFKILLKIIKDLKLYIKCLLKIKLNQILLNPYNPLNLFEKKKLVQHSSDWN